MKITFNTKLVLVMTLFILFISVIFSVVLYSFMKDMVKQQTGNRAIAVAESIAHMPSVQEAFHHDNPTSIIQPIIMPIMKATDAQFIVVGDRNSIRVAHPVVANIGKPMEGEDNARAFLGETYVSESVGSLGASLRGKTPIRDKRGDIVGVVSVGFFIQDLEAFTLFTTKKLVALLLAVILGGLIGAFIISYVLKKQLYGLAPDEIVKQFIEKENILQFTQEGVIATDNEGKITLMNDQAEQLLALTSSALVGQQADIALPQLHIRQVINTGKRLHDYEVIIGDEILLINAIPMMKARKLHGVVATFRSKHDMDWLQQELIKTKQYANALRSQTHEFSNKLHVIYGLLQLNERDEAMAMIKKESELSTTLVYQLIEQIADPYVSAMLIAKLHVAQEQHSAFIIDDTSKLSTIVEPTVRHALLTALGNVLDNAMEAIRDQKNQQIYLYFTDIGNEIVFEIENSGVVIPAVHRDRIFQYGFTTKSKGERRGVGLALSRELLRNVGGDIYVEDSEEDTCFIITLPKEAISCMTL